MNIFKVCWWLSRLSASITTPEPEVVHAYHGCRTYRVPYIPRPRSPYTQVSDRYTIHHGFGDRKFGCTFTQSQVTTVSGAVPQ